MELPVINRNGSAIDTINVDDAVFNVPMNQTLGASGHGHLPAQPAPGNPLDPHPS